MKSNDREDVVAKSYKNMPDTLSVDSVIKKKKQKKNTQTHTHTKWIIVFVTLFY